MHINKRKILKSFVVSILVIFSLYILVDSYIKISKKLSNNTNQTTNLKYEGVITDTTYYNSDLGWTFSFPSSYAVIDDDEVEFYNRKGDSLTDKNEQYIVNPISLLNISCESVSFWSSLRLRQDFPEIKSEEDFFNTIEEDFNSINDTLISFKITSSNDFEIDNKNFSAIEYVMVNGDVSLGGISIARVTEDYILDISIVYSDIEKVQVLFECLLKSKLDK